MERERAPFSRQPTSHVYVLHSHTLWTSSLGHRELRRTEKERLFTVEVGKG